MAEEHPRRPHRRLAGAAAISTLLLFFCATHHHHHHHRPTPRIDHHPHHSRGRRTNFIFPRVRRRRRRRRLSSSSSSSSSSSPLSGYYADPKSVVLRPMTISSARTTGGDGVSYDADEGGGGGGVDVRHHGGRRRANCQIIYVLGVEGSIHHGFMPIIKSLAERQIDLRTGMPYGVVKGSEVLREAIFRPSSSSGGCARNDDDEGGGEEDDGGGGGLCVSPMSDPASVQDALDRMCPDDGTRESRKMHVIIEGNSFPSGRERERYRVTRRDDWPDMTPGEIAFSTSARNHPTNLWEFYDAFGPYADVRFVVLHRPYLETIASHPNFDGGPERHSVVISGFALLLGRFLAGHMYGASASASDPPPPRDGGGGGGGDVVPPPGVVPLWTLVCADRLTSRSYRTERELIESREGVLTLLANFLGWPISSCPGCFDDWAESPKVSSPRERLGDGTTSILLDHARSLEASGWPPRRPEDRSPLQRCGLL